MKSQIRPTVGFFLVIALSCALFALLAFYDTTRDSSNQFVWILLLCLAPIVSTLIGHLVNKRYQNKGNPLELGINLIFRSLLVAIGSGILLSLITVFLYKFIYIPGYHHVPGMILLYDLTMITLEGLFYGVLFSPLYMIASAFYFALR